MVLSYANFDDLFINQCWVVVYFFYEGPRVPVLKNKLKWLMQFEPK